MNKDFPVQPNEVKYFRAFVFNNKDQLMLMKKGSRVLLPNGKKEENESMEDAVQRVVFEKTKTALSPVVPVKIIITRDFKKAEIATAIVAARTNGEARINPDEKMHHLFMETTALFLRAGFLQKSMHELFGLSFQTLAHEEWKTWREKERRFEEKVENV